MQIAHYFRTFIHFLRLLRGHGYAMWKPTPMAFHHVNLLDKRVRIFSHFLAVSGSSGSKRRGNFCCCGQSAWVSAGSFIMRYLFCHFSPGLRSLVASFTALSPSWSTISL
jgi:hypothetical protein